MDDKILFLYAQGMSTREIVIAFKEFYGADISASLVSKVTDAVLLNGSRDHLMRFIRLFILTALS